uniref:Uncharacterized protein n=1 Tax=Meloidogyne javanica TaxID=6303 RepID=A0A915MAN9_MELJA
MNGVRQENDSLEELVRQLKLSFLALDSENKNDEIKRNDNLENSIILPSQGNFSDHSTRNVCGQHAHGYSRINANYAISRLTRRDLLRTENTLYSKPTSNLRQVYRITGKKECICRKCISVPSLNISSTNPRHFVFESNGLTNTEAEMDCNLRILAELWDFDMIKEANMELYTLGRKELLDPTRKLNLKLFAWLEASTDTWVSKMNEIEEYQGLEGLIFEKNLFLN